MSTNTNSVAWYNEHAEGYTRHIRNPDESIYHSLYEKPAMYSLLPNLKGKTVISLGCASGEDCHHLAQQGAHHVDGIDISEGLIAIAQKSYPECQFQVMDMEQLSFPDEHFDFAYSSLAIHYIQDWAKVLQDVYRILKPNSYFLFSCNHPVRTAMHTIIEGAATKSELSLVENSSTHASTTVGNYLTRRALGIENGFNVTTWHKPIGEISREVTEAGFMIAEICEPKPLEKMHTISPQVYELLEKIPHFIIFKLWKPNA
ncbi:MAG TPA: class I SAM-dependent methyltransferase [Candidatus Acidoferrum sp.]|nr:class I SAM-dependent methyltransferase [Candidatus Acidoferrum sp.]